MTGARERRDCCLFLRIFFEVSPFLHFTWLLQTSHWLELGIYSKPTVGQRASCFCFCFFFNCSTLPLQCEISYKRYINGCDCSNKKLFTKVGTRQNCCVVWSDLWCVICPGYRLPKDWSSDWSFSLKVVLRRTTWVSNEIQGFVFFSPQTRSPSHGLHLVYMIWKPLVPQSVDDSWYIQYVKQIHHSFRWTDPSSSQSGVLLPRCNLDVI